MNLIKKNKNYIINANCLDVLERLEDNSVDLVYLDPPWKVGSPDFIYRNDGNNIENDYEEFIYSVLQQSKRVLKQNGNLVLYSIPSLNVNFHNLIIPVFGSDNFKAEFIIPRKRLNIRNNSFSHNHETVIFYSVSGFSKFFPLIERNIKEIKKIFPLNDNGKNYKLQSLILDGERPNLNYDWNGFQLPSNKVWRYSQDRLNELEKDGKIYFGSDMRLPRLKVYSDEFSLQMVDSVWSDIEAYEKKTGFGAQSIELLDRIIQLSTTKNDMVLVPFMGTGVSGVSSIKNKRQWIGIEANEKGFKIAEKKLKTENALTIPNDVILDSKIIWDNYESYKLSASELLLSKIVKGENERLEFKEAYNYSDHQQAKDGSLPNKIMKEIAAFLNSKYGGSILLGVRDNKEIRGLQKDMEVVDRYNASLDKLELAITSKIKNSFNASTVDLVSQKYFVVEDKTICEIVVIPSENPVFLDKKFYVRNGTQADTFQVEEFYDLMKKRRKLK